MGESLVLADQRCGGRRVHATGSGAEDRDQYGETERAADLLRVVIDGLRA